MLFESKVKNIVYFDLETQKSADEVGGWNNISKMGMSVGVTYSTARGEYRIYGENQVTDLINELQRADLVVGFNNLRFDYEVLARLHATGFDADSHAGHAGGVAANKLGPPAVAGFDCDGDVRCGENGGGNAGDRVVQGKAG